MGRRLEYEVKTSVRLNMSNPQHGSLRIKAWISIQWQLLRLMVQAAWMLILF